MPATSGNIAFNKTNIVLAFYGAYSLARRINKWTKLMRFQKKPFKWQVCWNNFDVVVVIILYSRCCPGKMKPWKFGSICPFFRMSSHLSKLHPVIYPETDYPLSFFSTQFDKQLKWSARNPNKLMLNSYSG